MLYSTYVKHVSISPTNGFWHTQGQRKTLNRVITLYGTFVAPRGYTAILRQLKLLTVNPFRVQVYSWLARDVRDFSIFGYPPGWCSTTGKISMCLYAYMPSLFTYNGFFGKRTHPFD